MASSRFSAPQINREALDEFRRGAPSSKQATPKRSSKRAAPKSPIPPILGAHKKALRDLNALDPLASPSCGINLRLNAYQRQLLQHAAKIDGRSQQKLILRILVKALEEIVETA